MQLLLSIKLFDLMHTIDKDKDVWWLIITVDCIECQKADDPTRRSHIESMKYSTNPFPKSPKNQRITQAMQPKSSCCNFQFLNKLRRTYILRRNSIENDSIYTYANILYLPFSHSDMVWLIVIAVLNVVVQILIDFEENYSDLEGINLKNITISPQLRRNYRRQYRCPQPFYTFLSFQHNIF